MLHPLSQACVFIYSSCGKWVFPPLLWSFHPTATFTSFPTPDCWACATAPTFSGQLVYLQFRGGLPLPHFGAQGAPPYLPHVFFLLLLIIQFFFFFPWVGSVWPGGYADLAQGCLWEYRAPLSLPCGLRLPQRFGCWHLAAREPSWFLHLMQSGNAMHGVGVWRSQSFASSQCKKRPRPVRCIQTTVFNHSLFLFPLLWGP
jgi:hypothetical protein